MIGLADHNEYQFTTCPQIIKILLTFVLLYNRLQAKKSVGVATSVKVANLVPDSLEVNR
jgi:hypothetical protein